MRPTTKRLGRAGSSSPRRAAACDAEEARALPDEELERKCITPGHLRPLGTDTDRRRAAEGFRKLAEHKLEAARVLLDSPAARAAVGEAYFAMEHKANELLAVHGWRSKSHPCTQMALSRLLGRKDLARVLSLAYEDRLLGDYDADPTTLRSAASYDDYVAMAQRFMAQIGDAIPERG